MSDRGSSRGSEAPLSTRPSSSSKPHSRGTDPSPEDGNRASSTDNGNSLQDAVSDVNFPLDDNLLQTIINNLTRCNTREVLHLPLFRLEELLDIVCRSQTQLLSEFKMTESLFMYYLLCLYVTLASDIPESFLLRFTMLLQHMICESLVIVQNMPHSTSKSDKTGIIH